MGLGLYLDFALVEGGEGDLEGRSAKVDEGDVARRLVGVGQHRRRAVEAVGDGRRARLVQQT